MGVASWIVAGFWDDDVWPPFWRRACLRQAFRKGWLLNCRSGNKARLKRACRQDAGPTWVSEEHWADARNVLYEKSRFERREYPPAAGFGERTLTAPGPAPTEKEIRFLPLAR